MIPPKDNIRRLLLDTKEGKEVLSEEVQKCCLSCESHRESELRCMDCERSTVLIVMDSEGAIEVYGPSRLRVHIAHRLIDDDYLLAERYMEENLPRWAKNWFWPIHLKAHDLPIKRTFMDERRRIVNLAILDGIKEYAEECKVVTPF